MSGRYPLELGSATTATYRLQHPARTNHRHNHPLVSMIVLVQNHRLKPKSNKLFLLQGKKGKKHFQWKAQK